jgi:hypothetical protein
MYLLYSCIDVFGLLTPSVRVSVQFILSVSFAIRIDYWIWGQESDHT